MTRDRKIQGEIGRGEEKKRNIMRDRRRLREVGQTGRDEWRQGETKRDRER